MYSKVFYMADWYQNFSFFFYFNQKHEVHFEINWSFCYSLDLTGGFFRCHYRIFNFVGKPQQIFTSNPNSLVAIGSDSYHSNHERPPRKSRYQLLQYIWEWFSMYGLLQNFYKLFTNLPKQSSFAPIFLVLKYRLIYQFWLNFFPCIMMRL